MKKLSIIAITAALTMTALANPGPGYPTPDAGMSVALLSMSLGCLAFARKLIRK